MLPFVRMMIQCNDFKASLVSHFSSVKYMGKGMVDVFFSYKNTIEVYDQTPAPLTGVGVRQEDSNQLFISLNVAAYRLIQLKLQNIEKYRSGRFTGDPSTYMRKEI